MKRPRFEEDAPHLPPSLRNIKTDLPQRLQANVRTTEVVDEDIVDLDAMEQEAASAAEGTMQCASLAGLRKSVLPRGGI